MALPSNDINDLNRHKIIESTTTPGQSGAVVLNPDGSNVGSTLATGAATSDNQTNGSQKTQVVNGANTLAVDSNGKIGINNTVFNADVRVGFSHVTTSNPLPVMPPLVGYHTTLEQPLSSVGSFLTTVTTAGTRVQLATNTCKSLTIKAKYTNTGLIYIGTSTVASTNGFQLLAGESVSLDISNTNLVYIDSAVNGEGISTIYVN